MISWNKKRKTVLIIGSGVWIFFLIVLSIYLYPEKRNDLKLEKKEWIELLRKENKKTRKPTLMKQKVRKMMRKNDLLTCSLQKNTHIATKGN